MGDSFLRGGSHIPRLNFWQLAAQAARRSTHRLDEKIVSTQIATWLTTRCLVLLELLIPFGASKSFVDTEKDVRKAYANDAQPKERFFMLSVLWGGLLLLSVALGILYAIIGFIILPQLTGTARNIALLPMWITFLPLGVLSVYLAFRSIPVDYYVRSFRKNNISGKPNYKWFHNIADIEFIIVAITVWIFCYWAWWQNYG